MKKLLLILAMTPFYSFAGGGGSPECNGPGETKVSWPTNEPVFELCYLGPEQSSAVDGSSLEIRDVYFNGFLAIERSHIPMLFAEYEGGTCYRDWKDVDSEFLRPDAIENPLRAAITTCDASTSPTQTVGNCPFDNVNGGGSVGSSSDCTTGVTVEKYDDRMVLTSNHSADWYKYSSRYTFYLDGRIAPRFGFGNSTGTLDDTTHYHHAYWRVNFDIDGSDNDQVFIDDALASMEFTDLRDEANDTNWSVIDSVTGRGYRVEATPEDYLITGQTTGAGFHRIDIMATAYKNEEYADTPGNNLFDCRMNEDNLVNDESITEDVVFWYRAAVQDIADVGLVCKFAGPIFYPIGDWELFDPDVVFETGFEAL
ncbi:MAG: hypothetical protein AB8B80_15265 [Marinicellaceae bacterium]